ncbi:uncharacterized protein LOC111378584 [Olea europaea var. sylvestris]|uniref:uncharacterized protein LOC111378584 n=1 Tax=Olea europaea var. sylvestris TaxID=158386 RepID=UPI000C1CD48C|nr:uncharacterized protein LOC111378584 [Olea europaea var. sylvestris]
MVEISIREESIQQTNIIKDYKTMRNSIMATMQMYFSHHLGWKVEQVQYVNGRNFNQRGKYSANQYHQGLQNHEKLYYGNNANVLQPPLGYNNQASDGKPSLEDILETFISETRSRFNKDESRLDNIETYMTNVGATMKNLETEGQKTEAEVTKKIYKPYSISFSDNPPILKPPLPFPQRYLKKEFDEKFTKFLEVFKKIHINIPFAEALAQMPNYAKFLKKVMSKKRKLEEFETVKLTEECSAILQKKLPHKLKDPSSFNIPCNIGGITFDRALCDLGASINLMPLSVFKKLGLGEMKPTTLTSQMADRPITYPKGIIEDVLMEVDKFIFPMDFVVLDMEEDEKVPLILGRPFLVIGRALIDVQEGKLTLQVNEEQVTFNIYQEKKVLEKGKVNTFKMIQSAEVIAGNKGKGELFYNPLVQYMAISNSERDSSISIL